MKIAVVEDDINMRKSLEIALSEYPEFKIYSFKNAIDAMEKIDSSFDLIITDINMPKKNGVEFAKELGGEFDIIVITGNADLNVAIELLRLGVKDFLTKPFEIETLVAAINRIKQLKKLKPLEKRTKKDRRVGKEDTRDVKIERRKGERRKLFYSISDKLQNVLNLALRAAKTDASVMLLGESGVGKELFAKYIHQNSLRKDKPFIALNMAAIPENLLESELFGYEKGAFTDATSSKKGHFELADGGTLFLDEIGEMPISLQAKILRAIQEKEIMRVGGLKPIKIDVRIISATNANMEEKIKNRQFREDLFYRLNTIPIKIPPLRERKEEIVEIAEVALDGICKKYGLNLKKLTKEAKKELLEYNWPGNVRELLSVVERAAILSERDEITKEDLFLDSRKPKKDINEMEKELIIEVLENFNYDLKQSSLMLGMSMRSLERKIKKYEIEVKK